MRGGRSARGGSWGLPGLTTSRVPRGATDAVCHVLLVLGEGALMMGPEPMRDPEVANPRKTAGVERFREIIQAFMRIQSFHRWESRTKELPDDVSSRT